MMIKKLQLAALAGLVFCAATSKAQLTITSGTTFMIQSGAVVTVQGDIVSNADISGPGKVVLKGSGNQNVNMNGFAIPNLEMDNTSNATLTGNAQVGTNLTFTNGKIQTGNFDLTMQSAATITGADNTKYVVTNGTGRLVKASLGAVAFSFPIGNSTTTYNPVSITNSGTADNIGARSLANVLSTGLTGTAFTKEVADASWDITEAVAGGSSLSLTANWLSADELAGFDRTRSGISYYIPTAGPTLGWDLLNSQTGAAAGAGTAGSPYNFTRTGVTSLGAFAIGTRPVLSPLLVSPKIFLQGPFTAGLMTDFLRTVPVVSGGTTDATHGVIPVSDPYTGLGGFTHLGSGGGETMSAGALGIFSSSSNDAIVDWAFVSLHNTADNSVISTRAVLLQRDGDVVETDGVSPVNMAGNPAGNYFVSIRHRNHLGVRSAAGIGLLKTATTANDYTASLAAAYAAGITHNAMASLTGGFFGLWSGDANGNKSVRYTGGGNDQNQLFNVTLGGNPATVLNGVYNRSDLNMNGNVRYTGGSNDQNALLNVALGGAVATVLIQPVF